MNNLQILWALLDYGSDLNCINEKGDTPLVDLLRLTLYSVFYPGYRQAIELCIYENPNHQKNLDAVRLGITLDQYLDRRQSNIKLGGICDGL